MKIVRLVYVAAMMVVAPISQAQERPAPVLPMADDSDEIIVQGLRIPRDQLPTGVYWNHQLRIPLQIRRENADMFLGCALRMSDTRWLRKVVDGEPNSADARFAQGWIVERHNGCYPPISSVAIAYQNAPNGTVDLGSAYLDRGVMIEAAIRSYAPDAALTPETMRDDAVRGRFLAREQYRNRLRLPSDRDALVLASCLVQEQPVLATRLVRSAPGSQLERGLTQAIIVGGRACLGGTTRVTVEPSITRIYVVDAFYRWVVAARGVESLIPNDNPDG